MFGRSDAEFRAHRNRRKSRLGKYNAEADRHFIPQPSPIIAPRRTLASRMNQVLYQEAALKRKTEAAKANPKKCLFSEPGYENNTDYYSMKAQKAAPYSTQYGFSAVEDHDVTGVYPMEDQSKTRILGGMEHQYTSGFRLPLKDHNFRSTTTTKPVHQLFKNFTTSTDSAKKCLKKQQQMLHWNVVQSPVPPQLSAFSNSKTLSLKTIESPIMPRLSTLPHALESAVKINVVPPEETGKPEDITHKTVGMQNFNHPTTQGQTESPMLNFKYPVTDESKSPITKVAENFRYPTTGQLNDFSKAQTKLPNSSYNVKAGSNSGNDVTNLNFPVPNFNFPPSNTAIDLSKLTNFNYPVSWKTNDLNNSRNPSDLCDPVPKQALYSENEASRDTSNMLVVDQKTKMAERQRKMSVSEMEFEKICQMRSEGSESLLVDFCRNGKSDSEENDFENTKEVKENVRPKQETNHGGRRSVSSNIVNGNGTRRSFSSNIVNGIGTRRSFTSTIVNGNSKLKQPQCYARRLDRKLQQPSVSDPNHHKNIGKESPKFIIRKRKDSFISNDTVDDDSFNNYDTILNNYESSTLIVNDPNIDDSLKAVDNIDETLSNIQLGTTFSAHPGETSCEINGGVSKTVEKVNDVEEEKDGDTFVVQKNLFAGKFYEENGGAASNVYAEKNRNLGDTFLISNNTSRKVLFDDKKFREVNKASLKNEEELINNNRSVDLGIETLNESLDNTLRFVQNETLCEDDENEITRLDSGVKNNVERDSGKAIDARTNSEAEINAGRNLEQEMDVNRLVEAETGVKNSVGELFTKNMETVEDNTLSSQNCQIAEKVLNSWFSAHQDRDISKLMEKQKLLVRKSEILFESRKQIMSQIKLLEESLVEQEEQFNELNGEFLGLFREFGEVVTNKQKGNDQVTVFDKINNENIDDAANSGAINNEKVSEIVPFSVRKTVFDTPRSARRVRRNLVFSQLKSDFSCLKTPLPSTAKKLHESTANKTILTPKSMSVCIQDQVNQLFDS
ncbi:hypothetical protein LSTR_LSTR007342 [Laodelphax striatellus]|uniref:Uncharacterized protein n=1 Tax=Laodelphax striatellus TaxID=195883 RepID=A0A482WSQ0_LAOST|nr:hypothetical protein LSTR_LSTR007342 [Laodelphax striatellus]